MSIDVGLHGCEHRVVVIDWWWRGRSRALVAATPGGEGLAVVVIERPLSAARLTVVQQHVVLAAHPRIKILHSQPTSRSCPPGELFATTEKVRVESGLDRTADRLREPRKVGLCLPPRELHHEHLGGSVGGHRALEGVGESELELEAKLVDLPAVSA